jgi:hypothetical protein
VKSPLRPQVSQERHEHMSEDNTRIRSGNGLLLGQQRNLLVYRLQILG